MDYIDLRKDTELIVVYNEEKLPIVDFKIEKTNKGQKVVVFCQKKIEIEIDRKNLFDYTLAYFPKSMEKQKLEKISKLVNKQGIFGNSIEEIKNKLNQENPKIDTLAYVAKKLSLETPLIPSLEVFYNQELQNFKYFYLMEN